MLRNIKKLPKDAKYVRTGEGWKAKSIFYSHSTKKYYKEKSVFPAIFKGYVASKRLKSLV